MSELDNAGELSELKRNQEVHNWIYHEVDRKAIESIAREYGDLIPQERIEAMRDLPTEFEERETFDEHYLEKGYGQPEEGRVLGYAQGTEESARVALDNKELPKTVYHERLHQAADPEAAEKLGTRLTEGITEDLASEMTHSRNTEQCYPEERQAAHEIREACGNEAVEKAYFQGDTQELRACLDRELGAPGLERLRDSLGDWRDVK